MAGLHEDITLKAARFSPWETLRSWRKNQRRQEGLSDKRRKINRGRCQEVKERVWRKGGSWQGQTQRRSLEKEPNTGSPGLKEGQLGWWGKEREGKSRATGIPQTCSVQVRGKPSPVSTNGSLKQTAAPPGLCSGVAFSSNTVSLYLATFTAQLDSTPPQSYPLGSPGGKVLPHLWA